MNSPQIQSVVFVHQLGCQDISIVLVQYTRNAAAEDGVGWAVVC